MHSTFRKFCVILLLATILCVISCSEGDDAARISKINPPKITADDTHWQASVEVVFSQTPVNIQIDSKLLEPDAALEVEPWSLDGEVVTLWYSARRVRVSSGAFDNVLLPILLINCDIRWSTGRENIEVELNPPRETFFIKDMGKIQTISPEELLAISDVLDRWREGYETESIETYLSAYWPQEFRYASDMGTDGDNTDDLVFDDIRDERDSAIRVFGQFQDIEIELSSPPEISMNEDGTTAEVWNHYRIQGFVADGQLLEGGFTGWYAEGGNLFIFKKRDGEWRITEWHDEAFNLQEIRIANNLNGGLENPLGQLTSWGALKSIP